MSTPPPVNFPAAPPEVPPGRSWRKASALAAAFVLLCGGAAASVAGDEPPAASPPPSAPATTDEHATENADLNRILKAVNDADSKTLFDFYQSSHDPIVHAFAAMAIERTRSNFQASSKDAQICEDQLLADKPAIALLCAQFRSGNLRLAGEAQAADALEADLVQRYRGRHVDQALARMQAYLDRQAQIPPLSVEPLASDVTIPFKTEYHGELHQLRTQFTARGNGKKFELLLDTGASNLVLGEGLARDLGVKPLDAPKAHLQGMLSKDVPVQRGILDTLQIDSITLHNVPVMIVPTARLAVFGADLIARLGTVRVTQKGFTVYTADSAPPACQAQMQISSDLWGNWLRILPEVRIDDQPHRVLLDTGASYFLLGSQAALAEVKKLRSGMVTIKDLGGQHSFANAEAAKLRLTIDNQPFVVYFTVLTDSELRYDLLLGAGALLEMDFVLDFRRGHLCFPMRERR